jgi:hypothetical protein
VHRTLHCAMSGAPVAARSNSISLCAVRWFTGQLLCVVRCAPDRHCRLSGALISRFKKRPPARDRARGSLLLPACALSLCAWRFLPSPAISLHRRRSSGDLASAPLLSVSSLLPSSAFSLSVLVSRGSNFHPFVHFSKIL